MRAVVDTNVFVSALLSERGGPAQIVAAFQADRFTLVASEPILAEYAEVLGREKFRRRIPTDRSARLLALLSTGADVVTIEGTLRLCRDPKDDIFLETAVAGAADVLVTGDRDLTSLADLSDLLAGLGIRILTVRQFLQELSTTS